MDRVQEFQKFIVVGQSIGISEVDSCYHILAIQTRTL